MALKADRPQGGSAERYPGSLRRAVPHIACANAIRWFVRSLQGWLILTAAAFATFGGRFGKLQIGRVNRAAVMLMIEPDEHPARVYRADNAVPASSPRRPIDYAAPKVRLLRNDH